MAGRRGGGEGACCKRTDKKQEREDGDVAGIWSSQSEGGPHRGILYAGKYQTKQHVAISSSATARAKRWEHRTDGEEKNLEEHTLW